MENIIQIMNMIASDDSDDYNLACGIIKGSIANGEMYEWEIIYLLEYSYDFNIYKNIGNILLNRFEKYDVVSQSGKTYTYSDNIMRNKIFSKTNKKMIDSDVINDVDRNNPWWLIDNELNPIIVDTIKSLGFDNVLLKLH